MAAMEYTLRAMTVDAADHWQSQITHDLGLTATLAGSVTKQVEDLSYQQPPEATLRRTYLAPKITATPKGCSELLWAVLKSCELLWLCGQKLIPLSYFEAT